MQAFLVTPNLLILRGRHPTISALQMCMLSGSWRRCSKIFLAKRNGFYFPLTSFGWMHDMKLFDEAIYLTNPVQWRNDKANQLISQQFFCIWKAVWNLFLHMKSGLNIVNAIQQWLTKHGHSAAWFTSHLPLTEIWIQASINLHPLFWVLVVGKNMSVCTVNSLNFAAEVNNSL